MIYFATELTASGSRTFREEPDQRSGVRRQTNENQNKTKQIRQ